MLNFAVLNFRQFDWKLKYLNIHQLILFYDGQFG